MAVSVPLVKVKDRKYTNWLKVSLALFYMKNGIHDFIKSEVTSMHNKLMRIIYQGTSPQRCKKCKSKDIRWNGMDWKFPYYCNLQCGKWLDELQKLFSSQINPDRIYWTNSFVPEWPFNPWECAKIFLPRGQLRSNTGPFESDSQALMTLLANCQHFNRKLSKQGLDLTNDISKIRNTLMHSAAMEVSDPDMNTYIQKITCFLQDPVFKPFEECKTAVSNIQKINISSLDVFFDLDLEVTALHANINEIKLQLGDKKKTVGATESLKEEYKKLREDLEKKLKSHGTKMKKIENSIEQQEKKQQELQKTVSSHGERLDEVKKKVKNFGSTLQELKQQQKKHQEMETRVTQLSETMETKSADIASYGRRLVACEEKVESIRTEFKEFASNCGRKRKAGKELISDNGTSEAPTKRRRESEGLRVLKYATESNLDTFREMGFIPTTQTEEAKKLLQEKRSVVIKGNPGEGKTSTALHLIDNNDYINQRVVVKSPKEWKKVDTDWVKIVVLEDIFGQYDLDPIRLQKWMDDYLGNIQNYVDEGTLQVIITIRDDILLKAYSKLKLFKLFSSDMSLTLSSEKLENSDRMCILNKELKRNNKDMDDDEKVQCIVNFSGLIGFPQCCSLFAEDKDLFCQGPKFFTSPQKFFYNNIQNLNDDSFLSLAFLFCNHGKIEERYLSPSQIKGSKNYLPVLEELASYLSISFKESTVISLRQSYDHFSGLYVDKHHSGGNVRKSIQLSHASVYEAVGQVLGEKCPEMVVKYGKSGYLYDWTYTADSKSKDSTSQNVFIPMPVYGLLVKRMVHDVVEKQLVKSVVKHSALKQDNFLIKLKHELQNEKMITNFFMVNSFSGFASFPQDVSEGECITFLQHILQTGEDVVRLVYSHFMEFLACTHNKRSSDCWQCNEKQMLLELALYYHHFQIADKLISMSACYTHVSLCNAARHGDLSRVQNILEYLKKIQIFNPECIEAKQALCRATMSGNQYVKEILFEEGITLDSPVIPVEILHMDDKSIHLYQEALRDGKEKIYNIRVIVVGQYGVGKTTLTKRLLGKQVDISERKSTEGTDVYKHCCKVSLDTGEWIGQVEDSGQLSQLQHHVKLLTGQIKSPEVQKQHIEVIYQRKSALETSSVTIQKSGRHVASKDDKLEKSIVEYAALSLWDFTGQYVFYTTHQTFLTHRAIYLLVTDLNKQITDLVEHDEYYFDTEEVRLCQVKDLIEVWFNSIHCHAPSSAAGTPITVPAFSLTSPAADSTVASSATGITVISPVSGITVTSSSACSPVTSPAAGITVTSHAADTAVISHGTSTQVSPPDVGIPVTPPVILVGTHVDKIQEDKRQEVIKKYFEQICCILKDKPSLQHMVDFFAIDNTQIDSQLETLKKRIFQLASEQPYWGEEVPANWRPLEEALMKLKASGTKVIPHSLVEEMNQAGAVPIKTTEQLDLFLRFQHEIGSILYFSVEGLREWIVLEPQWLIDALKSLINAKSFILINNPAIRSKWFEFKEKGKLTPELIDAIWAKKKTPEFHDYKKIILQMMERLNIVARPRLYNPDTKEVKVESYYLVPCMLCQATPKKLISLGPNSQQGSTSILCFVFTEKCLPLPVFHRLLAACMAQWPIATQKSENLIFCGCCVFGLDLHHRLTVLFREHAIFARVLKMGTTEKTPSSKLCIEVREFITTTLNSITGYLGQSLQFKLSIQCPESERYSVDCLIPVANLQGNVHVPCHFHDNSHVIISHDVLKFWFQEEERSDDG